MAKVNWQAMLDQIRSGQRRPYQMSPRVQQLVNRYKQPVSMWRGLDQVPSFPDRTDLPNIRADLPNIDPMPYGESKPVSMWRGLDQVPSLLNTNDLPGIDSLSTGEQRPEGPGFQYVPRPIDLAAVAAPRPVTIDVERLERFGPEYIGPSPAGGMGELAGFVPNNLGYLGAMKPAAEQPMSIDNLFSPAYANPPNAMPAVQNNMPSLQTMVSPGAPQIASKYDVAPQASGIAALLKRMFGGA